jgi:hypothetical protein
LAFIQKLKLPRDILPAAGKIWIEQIVRGSMAKKHRRCAAIRRPGALAFTPYI